MHADMTWEEWVQAVTAFSDKIPSSGLSNIHCDSKAGVKLVKSSPEDVLRVNLRANMCRRGGSMWEVNLVRVGSGGGDGSSGMPHASHASCLMPHASHASHQLDSPLVGSRRQ